MLVGGIFSEIRKFVRMFFNVRCLIGLMRFGLFLLIVISGEYCGFVMVMK